MTSLEQQVRQICGKEEIPGCEFCTTVNHCPDVQIHLNAQSRRHVYNQCQTGAAGSLEPAVRDEREGAGSCVENVNYKTVTFCSPNETCLARK